MREFLAKDDRLSEKERRNLNILDTIRRGGETSRADISKVTDLNIVTVFDGAGSIVKILEPGGDLSVFFVILQGRAGCKPYFRIAAVYCYLIITAAVLTAEDQMIDAVAAIVILQYAGCDTGVVHIVVYQANEIFQSGCRSRLNDQFLMIVGKN